MSCNRNVDEEVMKLLREVVDWLDEGPEHAADEPIEDVERWLRERGIDSEPLLARIRQLVGETEVRIPEP